MSDDNNSRYRSTDPDGHSPSPSGQSSDPLAELARLIGKNDPFSEFGRDARASRDPFRDQQYGSEPAPHHDQQQYGGAQYAPTDWDRAPTAAPSYDPFTSLAPPVPMAPEQHYDSHPY